MSLLSVNNRSDFTCMMWKWVTSGWSLPVRVGDSEPRCKVHGSSSIWSSGLSYYAVMQVTEKASSNRRSTN